MYAAIPWNRGANETIPKAEKSVNQNGCEICI